MTSKARLFGHAIHPILIVFPLGLLTAALVFDGLYFVTNNSYWVGIAYYLIIGGLGSGLLAAVFGWIDYLAIPSRTRAKAIGLWHGIGNTFVLLLFAFSWSLRSQAPLAPPRFALALSLTGVLLTLVTVWLGGELVERLGVSVDDGANLNAPNSLSGKPATRPTA